jgi:hypothetical protein
MLTMQLDYSDSHLVLTESAGKRPNIKLALSRGLAVSG